MINIIIVDDHPIFRAGLKQIIDEQSNMRVCGEAKNGQELYKIIRQLKWDIIVLDISLPDENGLDILKQIKYEFPEALILILSNYSEEQFAIRAFKAGAYGYMTKESAPREILKALKKIMNRKKYITTAFAEKLASRLEKGFGQNGHHILSDREFQVMCLIGSGRSIKEIADTLLLSVQTVSTYRSRILSKMNFKTNADIIRYSLKNNLVE